MPSPHLTLWRDRAKPLRYAGKDPPERGHPDAGEQADDEGYRRCPMEDDRTNVTAGCFVTTLGTSHGGFSGGFRWCAGWKSIACVNNIRHQRLQSYLWRG